MKAYPYDVELKITNENMTETTIETRRVYAYNAMDAGYQAIFEAAANAGSANIRVQRIAPPVEYCGINTEQFLEALANRNGFGSAVRATTK